MARTLAQPPSEVADRVEPRGDRDLYLPAVALIGILAVWVRPLASSLWLDETGAFWVIQGDLGGVVQRALDFQGQFPLYHGLLWGWSRVAGTSELALRLPSLFGALIAAWLCYRLALRLFGDRATARLSACIFVLLQPVAFAAADARPYALALACLLGATLSLVRWLETGRPRDAFAYVGLAALTIYFHYLFALAMIPHAYLAARRLRALGRRGVLAAGGAAIALVVLLLPTIPHFVEVVGRRRAMSLFTFGSIPDVLAWVAPPMIVVAYLIGAHVRLPDDAPASAGNEAPRDVLVFLALWLVLPPLVLYVAGRVSGIGLYAERHFLSSVPALALLAGYALARLSVPRQRIGAVMLAMLFVLTYSKPFHVLSDWQGAAQAVNAMSEGASTNPVLVYTGFSESREMRWILDDERSRLFLAPLAAYPVDGRTYPLPYELTDRAREYVEGILASETPAADRIVLMTSELTLTYDVWLTERVSPLGYTRSGVAEFGDVRVVVFERS